MTQPIDVAYVDVVARTAGLHEGIKRIADEDAKKLEKSFNDATKNIEKDFKHTSDVTNDSFFKMREGAKFSARDIREHFTNAAHDVDREFRTSREHVANTLHALGQDFDVEARRVRSRFFNVLETGFTQLHQTVRNFGQAAQQAFSGLFGLVSNSGFVGLIIALIPPIIALVAALKDLVGVVGLLPAGFAVLVATVAPVIIAFQNFGGAVALLAKETPKTQAEIKKLNELLANLAPSARVVAKEVAGLIPLFKNLQLQVQQGFFQPLQGVLPRLTGLIQGPLKNGLTTVAVALGNLAAKILLFFSSQQSIETFNKLFATTARIVGALADPVVRFMSAMTNATSAGLPFVERLGAAFGRFLTKFAEFTDRSIASGSFNKFIEGAFTITKELIALTKSLSGFLGTLFQGTEQSGHDLIVTLTELFDRMNAFLKSAKGQEALKELVFLVKAFGVALLSAVEAIILLQQIFSLQLHTLENIGRGFVNFIKTAGKAIVDFFSGIPKAIGDFVAGIPKAIGDFLLGAFDVIFTAIGVLIGSILFATFDLPRKIGEFLGTLPRRIIEALAGTGPALADSFTKMIDQGLKALTKGWDSIVDFIKSVPDRIKEIGPFFLNAGKHLIESFKKGIRDVGHFVGDLADDMIGILKTFLNRAIDKINEGIRAVGKFLKAASPVSSFFAGDIPQIPKLASGAIVGARPGGTLAVVGEGGEDEVVSPLSKLRSMIGAGITFGPGSIVVNTGGQVPTLSEARSIGQAVGGGIISVLERTQIQAAVRAVG